MIKKERKWNAYETKRNKASFTTSLMKEVWYSKILCRVQTSKSFNETDAADDSSIKFSCSQQLTKSKGFAGLESITHAYLRLGSISNIFVWNLT